MRFRYFALALALASLVAGCSTPLPQSVTSVSIDQSDPQGVPVGGTLSLTASVLAQGGASDTVTWSSSNPSVASIASDTGVVTGNSIGSVTVKATSEFDAAASDSITVYVSGTATFANNGTIDVPGAVGATSGIADPYPSTIDVSGMEGTVASVVVDLVGFSSSWPADFVVLLVGPDGSHTLLMENITESVTSDVDLTFDATATEPLPASGALASGTYLPTQYASGGGSVGDPPAPAPERPYTVDLATFVGSNPNGAWTLFMFDQYDGDSGDVAGGWALTITTE